MTNDLQKASLMKRFSAFLLDFILLTILVTGFMLVFSSAVNTDAVFDSLRERRDEIEASYGILVIEEKYEVGLDKFISMTEEERAKLPAEVVQAFKDCTTAINEDDEYFRIIMLIINLILVNISISMFFSFLVLEFFVPLLFKNGQTVGKKIFAIGVMQTNAVRISPKVLFIRAVLGKYTISTMIPVLMIIMLFFGIITSATILTIPFCILIIVLFAQIISLIITKTNSLLHDLLSSTVTVDFASQMIFDSVEAKEEYQLRIHREDVKKSDY